MSVIQLNAAISAIVLTAAAAVPVNAYAPVDPVGTLRPGPGVYQQTGLGGVVRSSVPADFWGKEYSHDRDRPTPGQVTLWDGSGRTANGLDYGQNPYFQGFPEADVDALGATRDALLDDLIGDRTAMVFSYDDHSYGWGPTGWAQQTLPSSGPVNIFFGGGVAGIGGAGEITRSTPGTVNLSRWATQAMIDSSSPPVDVDGLEIFGDKPDPQAGLMGDATKYSMRDDHLSGWSVWNDDGTGYLSHSEVVKTVTNLLGSQVPTNAIGYVAGADGSHLIDVDAIVVRDGTGSANSFTNCRDKSSCDFPPPSRGVDQEGVSFTGPSPFPGFPGLDTFVPDTIVFSIRQIPLAGGGYYATGGELFVLSYSGEWFLQHGGVTWDHNFAENQLRTYEYQDPQGAFLDVAIDINALEAIADLVVPPIGPPSGDYNGDGLVDAGDYTVWRDNLGLEGDDIPGDGNGDGVVRHDDLAVWANNFGAVLGSSAATSVPEPSTVVALAGIAFTTLVGRRRG